MQTAYFDQVRFWLDLGVDGFRLDVINMVVKDKKFRNAPFLANLPYIKTKTYTRNRPKSYRIVRKLRKLINEYYDRVLIGEIYALPPGDPKLSSSYLGEENKLLHLAFDFSLMFRVWNAKKFYSCICAWYWQIPTDGWPCNVISNHDLNRYINRIPLSLFKEKKARIMAVMMLTLKGTPFIYYGDEIGMRNSNIRRKELVDPFGKKYWPFYKGRDRSRTPMQWNSNKYAGFSDSKPWLPVNPDFGQRNVLLQQKDENSLINQYIELIRIRKHYKVLQSGEWMPVITGVSGVLAYIRYDMGNRIIIILNFKAIKRKVNLEEELSLSVIYSTHRYPGTSLNSIHLTLYPFEAVILNLNSQD
jgi:alpha-glucosidase